MMLSDGGHVYFTRKAVQVLDFHDKVALAAIPLRKGLEFTLYSGETGCQCHPRHDFDSSSLRLRIVRVKMFKP